MARHISSLVAFGGLTSAAALAGGAATRRSVRTWYARLRKPLFNPPSWVFGPMWTALYVAAALAGWRVWKAPASSERTRALAWWSAQLGFNGLWSPLFFGRRRPDLALADSAFLVASVRRFRRAAHPVDPIAARLMTPYLAWVSFATVLNAEIVRLNRS